MAGLIALAPSAFAAPPPPPGPAGGGASAGAPAPAAPGPPGGGGIVGSVNQGLYQLEALGNVQLAQQDVNNAHTVATEAQQGVTAAGFALNQASGVLQAANVKAQAASKRVAQLAAASYMGESELSPTLDPSGANLSGVFGGQDATSGSSDSGALGQAQTQIDARAMIDSVASDVTSQLLSARDSQATAQSTFDAAKSNQTTAQSNEDKANQAVQQAQQQLTSTIAAATKPGTPVPQLDAGSPHPPPGSPTTKAGPPAPGGSSTPPMAGMPGMSGAGGAPGPLPLPGSLSPTEGPSINGPPVLTAQEMAAWFASTGHAANASVPIGQLAQDYISAGQANGIRGDIAFAQAIVETGFFSFPSNGQDAANQNNFAGIGACDTCATGLAWPDAMTGVTAQMQLLKAFSTPGAVSTPLVGQVGAGGCCQTWMSLAGKWATNPDYGNAILTTYNQMLDWAIPQRLAAAHLNGGVPALPEQATTPTTIALSPLLATTTTMPGAPPQTAPPTSAPGGPGVPTVSAPPPGAPPP